MIFLILRMAAITRLDLTGSVNNLPNGARSTPFRQNGCVIFWDALLCAALGDRSYSILLLRTAARANRHQNRIKASQDQNANQA
jgi:hypothetical protein